MMKLRSQVAWTAMAVALVLGVTPSMAAMPETKSAPAAVASVQREAAVPLQASVPVVEPATPPADELEASEAGKVDFTPAEPKADAVCSPPPECFRDKDCDRICGKGNGVCVRINSCYRACYCAS